MAWTDYAERLFNDFAFNGTAISGITPYLALYTANPSDTGGGTECADSNYARLSIASYFPADSGTDATLANDVAIEFAAFAAQQTITGIGFFDAPTSGNLIRYGALSANVTVPAAGIFRFNIGDLSGKDDSA